MAFKTLVRLLTVLMALALAACGGGGSSGPPPSADAGAAQTVLAGAAVALDGTASSDPGGGALSYAWSLTAKPTGSAATLERPTAANPGFVADIAGTYTASLTVSVGSRVSAASMVTITALPTETLSIVTDRVEPLSGTDVKLSLSGPVPGAEVAWYADLTSISNGTTAVWNSKSVPNGSHQLSAQVKISATKTVNVRRTVNVSNPTITLTQRSVYGSSGTVLVSVTASSPFGVNSVAATLDGAPLATLTAPNACNTDSAPSPANPCATPNLYQFQVINAASGNHTLVVTGVDAAGSMDQISIPVPISNAPVIQLTLPVNGALAYGSLSLAGTIVTDRPGVTVTATLGDVTILQAQGTSFSTQYDISGLAPGSYLLTVLATDSVQVSSRVQRMVFVTASSATAYAPMLSVNEDAQLYAIDGSRLLYGDYDGAGNGSVHLLDTATAADMVLAGPVTKGSQTLFRNWQVGGGRVFAGGRGLGDCPADFCVYAWGSDGSRSNLSLGTSIAAGKEQRAPVVRDGYVLWADDVNAASHFTLYALASATYRAVQPDAGFCSTCGAYDFAVDGGVVRIFYEANGRILRWDGDVAKSVPISSMDESAKAPQTDGTRVAWLSAPVGDTSGAYALKVQPVGGGATVTVALAGVTEFMLREGVLSWVETSGSNRVVKALGGSEAVTLASGTGAALRGVGSRWVVYQPASGKISKWSLATNQSVPVLNVGASDYGLGGFSGLAGGGLLVKGNTLYFMMGTRGLGTARGAAVYKVPLD